MRVHITNIQGLGATRLLESLLPEIFRQAGSDVSDIYLTKHRKQVNTWANQDTKVHVYRRFAPNPISRTLEVLYYAHQFAGNGPILVLGDIPLRGVCNQTVFIQTPFLVSKLEDVPLKQRFKVWLTQSIFRLTKADADNFIVQTEHMAKKLEQKYRIERAKIFVVGQPAPEWILSLRDSQEPVKTLRETKMNLFYPARNYPHKNHAFFASIDQTMATCWPIGQVVLTVPSDQNPNPELECIECVGELDLIEMVDFYLRSNALLFLSKAESYGLPLVEAMFLGMPIVCVDHQYAHELCGDLPFYFQADDPNSFLEAIESLHKKLLLGWKPDWSEQLKKIPNDWPQVATQMLEVVELENPS